MAAIALYVGIYHLSIHFMRRQAPAHLPFSLLCLGVALYDIFCVGLYSSHSVAQGVVWQRLQLHDANLISIFVIWFAHELIGARRHLPLVLFSVWFVLVLLASAILPPRFVVDAASPEIAHVELFGRLPVVYYEGRLGFLSTVAVGSSMLAYLYVLTLLIRSYLQTKSRQIAVIICGQVAYFAAVVNDSLVAARVLSSIYLSEYAFLIVILSMAYVLLDEFVAVYRAVETAKATLETRVAERTAALGRLATLVESSGEAIFGIDSVGAVTTWNRGAENTLGYSAEEMVGEPLQRLFPEELLDDSLELLERVMGGTAVESFETVLKRRDGRRIDAALTLSPVRDEDDVIVGIAATARDITERKALQAGIIRAERLESLEALSRGISHQFNNANAIVKNYLDLLSRMESIPDNAVRYIDGALSGVDRILAITERLEGLASSTRHSEKVLFVEELLRSLLPDFDARIQELGVAVKSTLEPTRPVVASGAQLGFVLSSLIDNALDSLVDRPVRTMDLRTGISEEMVYFEVRDSGCGIAREDLSKLFTPFFTKKGEWAEEGSSQSKVSGIGLSLAVSHSTVAEQGGSIEVESVENVGSTFRVRLHGRE